jgi:hypothetical protein
MQSFNVEERRRRLVIRHHLARRTSAVEVAAADMVGLHSSDPTTVYLSARARVDRFTVPALEKALYENRSLLRMLGMRRTMFVVPRDLAAVMNTACTQALVAGERKRLIAMLEDQGKAEDGAAWLERLNRQTLAALADLGEATAMQLRAEVPELAEKLVFSPDKKWGGAVGISTRVLFLLATEARIVRARPLGTWLSSQYRWALTDRWLDGDLPQLDVAAARAELADRWLRTFGPGTFTDIKWWAGWRVGDTKAALDDCGAVAVEVAGGTGFIAADDAAESPDPGEWVAFLPGLDPTVMGWKDRDWYLGGHREELFDRNGNAGPTVWHNGRVVGGWAQLPDGRVAFELLERTSSEVEARIEDEAQRLSTWFGDVRVKPRFRTPLEKRLSA